MILNWDNNLTLQETDTGITTKDWRESYYLWDDYFTSKEKAEEVFKKS